MESPAADLDPFGADSVVGKDIGDHGVKVAREPVRWATSETRRRLLIAVSVTV